MVIDLDVKAKYDKTSRMEQFHVLRLSKDSLGHKKAWSKRKTWVN